MAAVIPARVLHVVAVVLWIGGVAMVTTVILPSVRRVKSAEERVAFLEGTFRRIEIMHWVLLTLSLVTVAGTVAAAHGWLIG